VPAVVILGLVATALEGIGIGLVIPLLDVVMSGETTAEGWMPGILVSVGEAFPEDRRGIILGAAILLMITLKNVVAYGNGLLQAWIYGQSGHHLRGMLSQRLVTMEAGYCMTQPPSRLLNIVSNESWRASDAVAAYLSILVSAAATLIFLCFLLVLSPELTAVVLAGLVAIQVAHDRLSRHFSGLGVEIARQNRGLAARMLHVVDAWRLIRLFRREAAETARFEGASERVRRATMRLQGRQLAVGPAIEIAHAILFMTVIFVAWRVGVSFGTAAAFIILLYRLQPQVRQIQSALSSLRGWNGSLDEVAWLLDGAPGIPAQDGAVPAPALRDGIRFDNVHYRYRGEHRTDVALSGVTLDIEAGSSLAVIGRSGSGKSTIANLICGLILPTRGEILVDGIPMSRIDRASWLNSVALASQELGLFDGTVAENIRYGAPEASSERIERAARAADAHDFVAALPGGYDTPVGDRGVSFSAGQRQRISLARALVRDPALLILDEATNAMDILSESAALRLIGDRRGRATTVVISHHLSSIRLCDRYARVEAGRVVASGPTAEFDDGKLAAMMKETA
jgi:ABC-type multidrug transport system fused ATPase/permease subunit